MILVDFSAIMHQNIFGAVSGIKPHKDADEKYITSEFISYARYLIIHDLLDFLDRFKSYGKMVICLDNHTKTNWRCDILKSYKETRHDSRSKSPIDWTVVYPIMDELIDALKNWSSLHVLEIEGAEGDDVILCLAELCSKTNEKTVIVSADKDMIQVQRFGNIQQYSPLKREFISIDNKGGSYQDWHNEHCYLGDSSDNVPSVFKNLIFSDDFYKYVKEKNLNITPELFDEHPEKIEPVERTFGKPIFGQLKIGPVKLKKLINENSKTLELPLVKKRLERNKKLVLMEYIPEVIRTAIKRKFSELTLSKEYKRNEFENFLTKNECENLIVECRTHFENGTIDANFFLDDF